MSYQTEEAPQPEAQSPNTWMHIYTAHRNTSDSISAIDHSTDNAAERTCVPNEEYKSLGMNPELTRTRRDLF